MPVSVRAAWKYIEAHAIPVIDVMPETETFVLPEPNLNVRKIGSVLCNVPTVQRRNRNAPKKQQNLIGIIREIVESAGSAISYSAVRESLDSSGRYEFKSGVEGYYRTRQITSAVHNHIKKYGESALLRKTADGKIAING